MNDWIRVALAASLEAGRAILDIYESDDVGVEYKEDQSPLTRADRAAHDVLMRHLEPTGIPVLSEEGKHMPYSERQEWRELWIVDPVDGTKEFIKRNGEFTVNVALVHRGKPVLGVVGAPAISETFFGVVSPQQTGAWQLDALGRHQAIACSPPPAEGVRVLCSRNHGDTEALDRFLAPYQVASRQAAGSSLKLCRIAQGAADIYPRFGPTMAWDTAAAHAVLSGAGGRLCDVQHADLQYNPLSLKNPHFVALGLTQLKP